MTFRLPQIQISDRVYDIAKIAILVGIFAVFVVGFLSAPDANSEEEIKMIEKNGVDSYNFVICEHEPTNTNNTYPEGTRCNDNNIEQDIHLDEEEPEEESDEADEEEEEAMREADD